MSRQRIGSQRVLVVHCKREAYDVYIGRPSDWGNPFSHLPASAAKWRVATREDAIIKYEQWLLEQPELLERVRRELRGKVLGCYCAPLSCHGHVLARIANA
jgi:Domain of unknown function (DUF4326)